MLGVDIACLAALIAAFIMKAFPLTRIAGQVLEWVAAINNAVTTGLVVGAMVILATTYALEMDKISKKGDSPSSGSTTIRTSATAKTRRMIPLSISIWTG